MFEGSLLKGARILVTGGGTGLGKEMSAAFLQLGAEVYICGRRLPVLEATAQELMEKHGGTIIPYAVDISSAESVEEMVEFIWQHGPLTGLVNNAAGNFISRTKDLTPKGFDTIANIVFHGTFYVTHACGKRWIAQGINASVLSILTTWVWNGGPFTVPSAMSKSAINTMTKSLAVEWAPYGIRLNAIAPGPFPTQGAWERLNPDQSPEKAAGSNTKNFLERSGHMYELQNLAVFLMGSGCDYLTGQCIALDGGRHLAGSGNFNGLASMGDEDWKRMRAKIKESNAKNKKQRTV